MELKDVTQEFLAKASPGKGSIEYDKGFNPKYSQEEKLTAFWLLDTFGGKIILLNQKEGYKIKNPDYEWNEKLWELKLASTSNSLDLAVKKAIKQISRQPGGIIIEIKKYKNKKASIEGIIKNRIKYSSIKNYFVIIKSGNKLIKIYKLE